MASFLRNLFARKLMLIDTICRDKNNRDLLHVFGAAVVMPEYGDSFDIWRHSVINIDTFEVTRGLEQKGNNFSIKSPYAQRAREKMEQLLGRPLEYELKKEEDDYESEEAYDAAMDAEEKNALQIQLLDQNDTDTSEPVPEIKNGLILTQFFQGDHTRYALRLMRGGLEVAKQTIKGDCSQTESHILLRDKNLLFFFYFRDPLFGAGGRAFFVLDMNSGALLHDAYVL